MIDERVRWIHYYARHILRHGTSNDVNRAASLIGKFNRGILTCQELSWFMVGVVESVNNPELARQ